MALALETYATSIPSLKTSWLNTASKASTLIVSNRQLLMVLDSEDHVVHQKALVALRKLFAAAASSHGPCDNSKDYCCIHDLRATSSLILASGMIQIPKALRPPILNLLQSLHRLHHAPARPPPTSRYYVRQQTLTLRAAQQQAHLLSLATQRALPLQDPVLAQLKRSWTKANMSYTRTLIPRAPPPSPRPSIPFRKHPLSGSNSDPNTFLLPPR